MPLSVTVASPALPKDATDAQLQAFLLLGVFVAGKLASVQELRGLLETLGALFPKEETPFGMFRQLRDTQGRDFVRYVLETHRTGQYTRLSNTIRGLLDAPWGLRDCTRDELAAIPGISLKTASFFLLYSRDADVACLDVHLLRWMRNSPQFPDDIPTSTPARRRYLELERLFLEHCQKEGRRPSEVDLEIWLAHRRRVNPK